MSPSSERPRYAVGRNEKNPVAIEAAASRSGPPIPRAVAEKRLIEVETGMPLGSIADAELNTEIDTEADKEHSECDRDQVQRSHHPEADGCRVEETEDEIDKHREDKPCLPQREPQHQADKKQCNDTVEHCAVGDRGKLLVRKSDRPGETHRHPLFGREPQPGSRFAYRRGRFASGLKIGEIKDRLDVHEAAQLRKLRLRPAISLRQEKEGLFPLSTSSSAFASASSAGVRDSSFAFPGAHPRSTAKMYEKRRAASDRRRAFRGKAVQKSGLRWRAGPLQAEEENAVALEELAAIRTADLRIRSDLDASSLTSASAASSTASGVAASMTAMSWSIRCGNWAFSIALAGAKAASSTAAACYRC